MKALALLSILLPAAALAHQGTAPHVHPHGIENTLALVIAAGAVIAAIIWRRFRR